MTEPDPVLRRRGPFGLVLRVRWGAEHAGKGQPNGFAYPVILGPTSWVSFDVELERWRIRRPDGTLRTTASVVVATLEVARLLERTAADEVVEGWLRIKFGGGV